jgi:hypothetical protein
MMRRNRFVLSAAISGVVGVMAVGARGASPATQPAQPAETQQQLIDEVHALRAEVERLKAEHAPTTPATPAASAVPSPANVTAAPSASDAAATAAAIDATKLAVEKDAADQTKSIFADVSDDVTAGFLSDRFTIQSADQNFVFRPWVHMQFRYVVLNRQDFKPDGSDQTDSGFEMRRLRFGFDGNLFTPDLTYFFNWATVRASGTATVTNSAGVKVGTVSNNLGGTPLLEEGWAKYRLNGGSFYIKEGQIKDPLLHDQIVSSRNQQSTERSVTADVFANGDAFTEGVTVIYDPKSWVRTEAGVTNGLRSANTNFLDPPSNAFNYGAAGRAEFKFMGRWQDYNMGAIGVKEPLAVLGVGGDYTERGDQGQTVAVVDGMYAGPAGLSLYVAGVDRYTTSNFGIYTQSATGASIGTPDPAVANRHTNEYSLLGQVGYVIAGHLEPFGRYEYMKLQGTPAGSHNYVQIITAGANYYFVAHRCKLTAQASYFPNGFPIDDSPSDLFANNGNGIFLFETQFQLLL